MIEESEASYGVVTACLNSEATIKRTIASVLEQTALPIEHVFVDGGSFDDTLAVIEMYRATYLNLGIRLEVIYQNGAGGIAEAWNIGIGNLQSEYVFILNSDDWYPLDTAEKVLAAFQEYPSIEIILGSGSYFDGAGLHRGKICRPRPFWVLPFAMPIIHPACFVKRVVYERLGYFNSSYRVSADYDFIYRCVRGKIDIHVLPDVLVNVQNGGFASQNCDHARDETLTIGMQYSYFRIISRIAWGIRYMLGR